MQQRLRNPALLVYCYGSADATFPTMQIAFHEAFQIFQIPHSQSAA